MIGTTYHNIIAFLCLIFGIGRAFLDKEAIQKFKIIVKTINWKVNFGVALTFSIIIILYSSNDNESIRFKEALKKGILAFIIGILSEMGLTIAQFCTILAFSFFLDGWV